MFNTFLVKNWYLKTAGTCIKLGLRRCKCGFVFVGLH